LTTGWMALASKLRAQHRAAADAGGSTERRRQPMDPPECKGGGGPGSGRGKTPTAEETLTSSAFQAGANVRAAWARAMTAGFGHALSQGPIRPPARRRWSAGFLAQSGSRL